MNIRIFSLLVAVVFLAEGCRQAEPPEETYIKWTEEARQYRLRKPIEKRDEGDFSLEMKIAMTTLCYREFSDQGKKLESFLTKKFMQYCAGDANYKMAHSWDVFFAYLIAPETIDPHFYKNPHDFFRKLYELLDGELRSRSDESIYTEWMEEARQYQARETVRGNLNSEIKTAMTTLPYREFLRRGLAIRPFLTDKFMRYCDGDIAYKMAHPWDVFFAYIIAPESIDPYSFNSHRDFYDKLYESLMPGKLIPRGDQ